VLDPKKNLQLFFKTGVNGFHHSMPDMLLVDPRHWPLVHPNTDASNQSRQKRDSRNDPNAQRGFLVF